MDSTQKQQTYRQKTNTPITVSGLLQKRIDRMSEKLSASPIVVCQQCKTDFYQLCKQPPEFDPKRFICPDCRYREGQLTEHNGRFARMVGTYAAENFTFDKFKLRDKGIESAFSTACEFDPTRNNLFLWGPCGVGKTHLAVAILNKFYGQLHGNIAFERPHSMARYIRGRTGDEENAIIQKLASRKLIVWDDLGLGKASQFMMDFLYDIIDYRKSNKINGLIITSNIDLGQITKRFGDDRLSSRINGLCEGIEMQGTDARLDKLTQEEIPF